MSIITPEEYKNRLENLENIQLENEKPKVIEAINQSIKKSIKKNRRYFEISAGSRDFNTVLLKLLKESGYTEIEEIEPTVVLPTKLYRISLFESINYGSILQK